MKYKIVIIVFLFISIKSFGQNAYTLRYQQPAKYCNKVLPIGNGTLGAIIFGRTGKELIQLNE